MIIDVRIKPPLKDTHQDPRVTVPPEYERYNEIYGYEDLMNITLEELISEMEQNGVTGGVVQSEHEWGEPADWNDRVGKLVNEHDIFATGWASADPRRGMDAVRELDRAYHDLGLRGLVFEPGLLKISPTNRLCYPLYAKCVELNIPVALHTGVNFSSHGPISNGRPLLIDEVACDFPELIIICNHGGWPWPAESVAVTWKHPNVYLEFGAISPKYIASGGGWDPMPHFMNSVLQDQILFGTDWPMIRYQRVLKDLDALELKDSVREKYLYGNAQKLLERTMGTDG